MHYADLNLGGDGCHASYIYYYGYVFIDFENRVNTSETEISAAIARISAHETTPGQTFSRAVLISSITSNPSREPAF